MLKLRLLHLLPLLISNFAAAYTKLSDDTLKLLPDPGNDFDIHTGALLAPILVPRVPGTPGSLAVLGHFIDFFKTNLPEWHLELQNSTSRTPATGDAEIPFVNFIASRDPPWSSPGQVGRLALVAHYDSKMSPAGFIGATDSAAPCAMILHAVRSIDKALTNKWATMQDNSAAELGDIEAEKGVQVILLDGEEAFVSWTDLDSLYGARSGFHSGRVNTCFQADCETRALAEFWDQSYNPALSAYPTPLSSISLFLLLDLLGAKNPTIPSYFMTTHWAYKNMADVESRLRNLQQFKSSPNHPSKRTVSSKGAKARQEQPRKEPVFLTEAEKSHDNFRSNLVSDDHIPFMARGVDVLHMIPIPFPRVWHDMDDNGEHLDIDTVEDWAKLVAAFTAEWMDLEGFFELHPIAKRRAQAAHKTVISKTEL